MLVYLCVICYISRLFYRKMDIDFETPILCMNNLLYLF